MAFLGHHFREHDNLRNGVWFPEHWAQFGAWLILSDLARRHPGALSVVEGVYPAGGTVWFLLERPAPHTPVLAARKIGTLNEMGHLDIVHSHRDSLCPISEGTPEGSDQRILTIAPVVMGDLRQITYDIERCAGLPQPSTTPPTSTESIGWWVVATVMGLYMHSRTRLQVGGVLWDGVSPSRQTLESFPALSHLIAGVTRWGTATENAEIDQETGAELLGLVSISVLGKRDGESSIRGPVLVVDLHTGVSHTKKRTIDLMNDYRSRNRNIESVSFHTIECALNDSRE